MIDRRTVLQLAGWLAIAMWLAPAVASAQPGCANTLIALGDEDGIGGTGLQGEDDGIGGTGFGEDDGIGGTGFGEDDGIGGTGVFGTITGLGSICVDGLHIQLPTDAAVTIGDLPAKASELRAGHVVWVIAHTNGQEWLAKSVAAIVALVGVVDEIDTSAGRISVDGKSITILAAAPVAESVRVGARVSVSGLRRPDGSLVASRIDPAGPDARSETFDLLRRVREAGLHDLWIEYYFGAPDTHALPVDIRGLDAPIATGERVWLRGTVRGGALRALGAISRPYPGDLGGDRWTGDEFWRPPPGNRLHRDRMRRRSGDHKTVPAPDVRALPDLIEPLKVPILPDVVEPPEVLDLEPIRLDLPDRR